MPAQWTGVLIGEIHNAGLTIKAVATEAGLNEKYVSQVLNSDAETTKVEGRLRAALERMITSKETQNAED